MADLESQHSLEATTQEKQKEGEISPEQLKQARDAKEEAEKAGEKALHELVERMITPYEVAQVQRVINSFDTIQTGTTDQLKEQLGKDPDLKLASIPAGSRIMTIFQGGPDTLKIKYLNDKILGMQGTNEIIIQRQANIKKYLLEYGIVTPEQLLNSTYKLDKFVLSDEQLEKARNSLQKKLSPEELPQEGAPSVQKLQLSSDPEVANQQMIDHVLGQAEQETRKILEDKITKEITNINTSISRIEKIVPLDEGRLKNLRDKLADLQKCNEPKHLDQFSLNFGISQKIATKSGTTEGFAERVFSDQKAEAWARVTSERAESAYESEHRLRGSSYNVEGMMADMNRVGELRNDPDLRDFFEADKVVNGQKVVKLDAIGILRKWSDFEATNPDPTLKAKYEKLRKYYQVINRFDYIKSWTNIEDAKQETDKKQQLINSGGPDAIREQLKTNPKATGDMTDAEFTKEAVDVTQARYLILDVVGMGNDNVRSFERVFLAINNRLKTEAGITTSNYQEIKNLTANNPELDVKVRQIFQEEGMKAGNDVTTAFKKGVTIAQQEIQNFCRENGFEGKLVSVPGGDEWTVVLPETLIRDETALQKVLLKIQKETNMRISLARKSVASDSPKDKIRAHKETLKNNEVATDYTKKLEKEKINGVFFTENKNGSFAAVLNLPGGPQTIEDSDAIWPAVESLQKQSKSPITHADIWNEYQRQITKQPNVEAIAQAA